MSPASNRFVEEIVFTYDGSESSFFAIKQFSYIFSELNNMKLIVLSVKNDEEDNVADERVFHQWICAHYSDVFFLTPVGDTENLLLDYLEMKHQSAIIVMGAYGRSRLSQFLKPSIASPLLSLITQPVFIAHV